VPLVDRSDPGTYRLGMRCSKLGNLVKARLSVRDAALMPMRELHRLTGQRSVARVVVDRTIQRTPSSSLRCRVRTACWRT